MGVEIKWRQGSGSKTQPLSPLAVLVDLPALVLFIPPMLLTAEVTYQKAAAGPNLAAAGFEAGSQEEEEEVEEGGRALFAQGSPGLGADCWSSMRLANWFQAEKGRGLTFFTNK